MKKFILISLFALTAIFISGCIMNVTYTCEGDSSKKEMKADHRKQRGRTIPTK